ncbi:CDP-diacylglycerol---glycerol-3-phosphate 3-phosphatidyltransferase [Candidatus Hakubella thermalkaliphila]|uniref:CDP-diacylglycerol--glycerol-3-phosphate 3-phosphatidyltransferase n=2 Tax=Candidatus Hakubella thermalkaliphila TaxID=2754717 RepID=A0A6V8NSH3_9ACTN|nr:CDP-diacylglycerol--glycerol-3-phosphate 3-phosphatidyltransferase [Candidatus Hakubella thermalkaliphila]GFP23298.1 CDP-diacylglycerol---glycerol-3-phosphate 3-phosphatidyltransferase [Candidatus Hakubella thermalkaliphila]GFP30336.1 CDP-diacylglycerol---glycerol-3-phosphate 3-phosphatidyltransferase [Candidatus Hakubella thermalkaliphila]GFP43003.1 CDP-diacylglycerol---glycerol-3-phosphate 3-phosphatidyltransferase [Candidatus Hakubella thermalkaliphila]
MNLSSRITIVRILLVPVFMVFLLTDIRVSSVSGFNIWVAVAVFCIAALTDTLDGYLARSRREVTVLGSMMDTTADKLLISAALISLVQLGTLSAWVAMVIISRELAVSGLRSVAAAKNLILHASIYGKMKTSLQIVAVVALILDPAIFFLDISLGDWLMAIAIFITIISGFEYFARSVKIFAPDQEMKQAASADTARTPWIDSVPLIKK